jgi:hypothetical protein
VAINRPAGARDRVLRYLYSTKNLAGSALALVGLGLFFTGAIGAIWPPVVVALYLVGALVAPGVKTYDLTGGGASPDDVRKALDTQVKAANGKVPPEIMAKVLSIRDTILGILPNYADFPPGSPDLFVVQSTAVDYLPTALQSYLNLPRAYAMLHPVADGKTPRQILLDQLTLLDAKITDVADAVHQKDSQRLLANGRFLAERFGQTPLTIAPPTQQAS